MTCLTDSDLLAGPTTPAFDEHLDICEACRKRAAVPPVGAMGWFAQARRSSSGGDVVGRYVVLYFDRETRLHSNFFRDYDPSTGRYIESDPIGLEGGLNTYAYVKSMPLDSVDPTGQQIFLPLVPAAVGGGVGIMTMSPKENRLAYELQRLVSRVVESCRNCPPCDPPAGTACWQRDEGHTHKGLDPHFHIYLQEQESSSCTCQWKKKRDDKFTFGEPPPSLIPCASYPGFRP